LSIKSLDTSDVILLILLVVGMFMDLRYRRLPNWLTLPTIIIGIIIKTWSHGLLNGALDAIGGVLFAFVLLLPFIYGGLGGGDLKFLAAIGALKGFQFVLWSALYGAVLGGLVSAGILISQKRFTNELWRYFLFLRNLGSPKAERPNLRPEKKKESLFPYGVVIVLGTITQWVIGG
jgi:prepilin peptidase CpaA